ncbi:hypothetical protein C499_12445 [Halogeometricum borinquense DSM 11551]|uniref:Uncharacterized protein n=1 Tax=Halogeometricum borinquense (strain ATCC 700274 / DSM 11551 / JCM 10706 / KCTC 4070 / PR3) TaxID=469382 RepID=E4NWF9_HALBP|nr:hypothetical protein [Halogeometricum borinquense]ADQ69379.1 hypothetical protein Hbor_36730 [Halogeometricum borinquense DSM 11551]ELY26048.1 hypothetical protein C499_12445 [Halogeometricum borinquense DSM 11551]
MGNGLSVVNAVGSGLLVFAVLMLFASPILYRGWQNRVKYHEYARLHAKSPNVATDGEIALLSGRIKDTKNQIKSPVQSEDCVMAFWKVATYFRYGLLGVKAHWSEEGVGIDAGEIVLAGDHEDVIIEGASGSQQLDSRDKLGKIAGSKRDSVLGSISLMLDGSKFEDRVHPTADWPQEYENLGARVGVQSDEHQSQGVLGRLLSKLRTPAGTVQFQEAVMRAGEPLTVVGRVVGSRDKRVKLEENDAVDPIITRLSPSELRSKHRRAYVTQLYAVPLVLIAFASLTGYAVYL